jgi:hypothetical protein
VIKEKAKKKVYHFFFTMAPSQDLKENKDPQVQEYFLGYGSRAFLCENESHIPLDVQRNEVNISLDDDVPDLICEVCGLVAEFALDQRTLLNPCGCRN